MMFVAGLFSAVKSLNSFYLNFLFTLHTCSRPHHAEPACAAPTATPAPPHCGGATQRESPCVTPVACT